MMTKRVVPALMAGLLAATLISLGTVAATIAPADFDYAVALYQKGRYAGAYGRFARLADAGNAEAAGIALFMVRNGKGLYGSEWTATNDQLGRWTALGKSVQPNEIAKAGLGTVSRMDRPPDQFSLFGISIVGFSRPSAFASLPVRR